MFALIALASADPSVLSSSSLPTAPEQELQVPEWTAPIVNDAVVGGAPSAPGSWPATAAVIETGYGVVCTGTLIAPTVVMTAAHCVTPYVPTHVRLNSVDGSQGGEYIAVASVTPHPDYLANETSDIAVIQLQSPATTTPVIIASDCIATQALYDGAPTKIVGFGATDPQASVYTEQMYEVQSIIHDADCSEDFVNGVQTGCDSSLRFMDGELMAGGNGVDSCNGDSGGPLYVLGNDGIWYVAGVTSRGVLTGQDCGNGGIYSRPDSWIPWLESVVGPLDAPTCGTTPPPTTPPPTTTPPTTTPPTTTPPSTTNPPSTRPEDPTRPPTSGTDDPSDPYDPPASTDSDELVILEDTLIVERRGLGSLPLYVEGAPMSELTFEIVRGPIVGSAIVSSTGVVTYAHTGQGASDSLDVLVTDLEGREATARIMVAVAGKGGCSTSAGPIGWIGALGGLLLLARRRR